MKKFLDRIKDQTKNFVEEVKEKNKGNRTELMLMGGFVLAFLALSVPEAVKEASRICGGCGRRKLSRG